MRGVLLMVALLTACGEMNGRLNALDPARECGGDVPCECREGFEWDGESCGIPMERIPAGTFQMGAPDSDSESDSDERPVHSVTITRSFLLARTEVTQAQYTAVTGLSNPASFPSVANSPVEQVSWNDAVTFCNALSDAAGLRRPYDGSSNIDLSAPGFRLPTEAEWEYAARAGTNGSRYGNLDAIAWHGGNSGSTTHAVGGKLPNAWGLYDMLGNVWEWTHDWYFGYGSGPVTDPAGPSVGSNRVVRGGSWLNDARRVRAPYRISFDPGFRGSYLGFRPVRSAP